MRGFYYFFFIELKEEGLYRQVEVRSVLHAEDTSIIIVSNKMENPPLKGFWLNKVYILNTWFSKTGFNLNPEKTQLLNFHLDYRFSPQKIQHTFSLDSI